VRENGKATLLTSGVIGVAVVANRTWEDVYGTEPTQSGPLAVPWRDKVGEAFTELDRLAVEWIGNFGWLDSPIPMWATVTWLTLIAGLTVVAVAVGSLRQRLALGLVLTAAVASAVVLSATLRAGELGGDVQARHLLPFLVLLPLLAGEIATRRRHRLDQYVPLVVGLTAALHVVAWYWNARRHATGVDGQLLFLGNAEWSPPLGWWFWLSVTTVGAGLTAAFAFVSVPVRRVRPEVAEPVISVVIPVKNGGADLARCLDAIAAQEVEDDVEVVVVDSGSTDGSAELARARGAHVHEIPAEEFRHGATRNLGASLAHGETLVFTTQDAYAADPHWLERLVAPLARARVAGAYGRQVPHDDANPPERYFLDFVYGPEPRTQTVDRPETLTFRETLFSNVSSAIRRSVWEKNPFPEDLTMSEDQAWSRRMLLAGWSIVYEPRAVVRHSHSYSLGGAFRRFFDSGASADRSFVGEAPESARALRGAAAEYARGELAWLWRTGQRRWIPYAAVYEGVKFAGLQLGLRHHRLPRRLRERLGELPPPER
jgi:rhamnosyltransferase